MNKKFTHIKETYISQKRTTKPLEAEPENSGCLGIFLFAFIVLSCLAMCSATQAYTPESTNECSLASEHLVIDPQEVVISLWVDMSGSSATGIVPKLSYDQLQPILDVYSQLDAASLSVGKIGASTRADMSFLSFRKSSVLTVPKRKPGQNPDSYKQELLRYKKRKARGASGSSFEEKIDRFEKESKAILNAPRNESQSQICEALNVSKRQFSQANVTDETLKFILVCSDMYNNGFESCPLSLGDAELVVVNRLSDPKDLVFHSDTQHFISVEEAIDYIVSKI